MIKGIKELEKLALDRLAGHERTGKRWRHLVSHTEMPGRDLVSFLPCPQFLCAREIRSRTGALCSFEVKADKSKCHRVRKWYSRKLIIVTKMTNAPSFPYYLTRRHWVCPAVHKLYHVPGSPHSDRTVCPKCFCTSGGSTKEAGVSAPIWIY